MSFINSAITVALCSLWPTLVNTAVGVASTDKDFLNVAQVLKLSWFKRISKVVLPASLPLVFTGLRLSLGVGWMVLIAAEMLAQNPGLGKFVWDMFQNGSSETLSMIMVAVLNEITGGGIVLAGKELDGPGPDRGIVFQSRRLLPWLSALDNVLLGVDQVFYTASKRERRQIAEHYLCVVGLGDALRKRPAELSQGMRQRVGIARAFALAPRLLLLDEPFGMLDTLTRFEQQQVLLDLWSQDQKTALMVTHDVDEALFLADRIVCMTNGPEAEVGEIMEVTFPRPRDREEIMEHPDYYRLREQLIRFLEERAHIRNPRPIEETEGGGSAEGVTGDGEEGRLRLQGQRDARRTERFEPAARR